MFRFSGFTSETMRENILLLFETVNEFFYVLDIKGQTNVTPWISYGYPHEKPEMENRKFFGCQLCQQWRDKKKNTHMQTHTHTQFNSIQRKIKRKRGQSKDRNKCQVVHLNTTQPMITLNVNGLNTSIKIFSDCMENKT